MDITADNLITNLRAIFETLPDPRTGKNCQFQFADIAMSAFSAFFMQCPSFLDHQRRLEEAHNRHACQSLFGIARIPTDNHIREKLDHIDCQLLYPAFDRALEQLVDNPALGEFTRLDGRTLIAIDGSQFHHSKKIQCPQCTTRHHKQSDTVSYHHSVLCATLVADGHSRVLPLRLEFITPQDGDTKQDCETKAAHRWIERHLPYYRHLRPVILGDDLFAHHPVCQSIVDAGCDFLLTAKPSSHQTLYSYLDGLPLDSRVTRPRRQKGRGRETRKYRWSTWRLPLHDTDNTLEVYWLSMCIQYRGKTTYENDFITSIEPTRDNITALADSARARWKIENEG